MSKAKTPENPSIFDITIKAPEGYGIEEVRIVADAEAVGFIEQYRDALYVARNIPFDVDAVSMADPLAMLISNQRNTGGAESIRQARQWYKNWQRDADQHSTILAFTAGNDFTHEPTQYVSKKVAPGLFAIPEPSYILTDPVERRLKQVLDLFNADLNFQMQAMTAINDAVAKLVQVGEAVDDAGFQPASTNTTLPEKDESGSKDGGTGRKKPAKVSE